MAGFTTARTRGDASSAMKTALVIPRGIAITIAPSVTRSVPAIKG
jgi:hypothetical protein